MRMGMGIVVLVLALGGCSKKSDGGGGAAPPPAGGGDSEKAAALKAAWEANADCQSLVKCCAAVPGTNWESSIGVVCEQVKTFQDFEEQAKNMVDVGWQDMTCKNTLDSTGMMGNDSNPVPDGCKRAE